MSPKSPPKTPQWEPDEDSEDDSDDTLDPEARPQGEPDQEIRADLPVPVGTDSEVVSVSDPLRRYMEEVRRYPLLSPEEELKLAVRLRETGDIQAAKTLVSANLRLVVKIAFEYRSIYSNVLDLVQEGNIGLMKAVSKFDPTKGARLGYYASWWIRSYMLKYLIDNFRLVKIGTTQAQKKLFYHLMREKERLEAQGLLAGPKLLADRFDVREKDVIEMQQRLSGAGAEVSIDTPMGGDESKTTHAQMLPDTREGPDDALAHEQLLKILADRLPEFKKTLKDKELKVLESRILSEEPKTLQEVANNYRLTRERVRQIESKVISKLRDFLRPALENRGKKPKHRTGNARRRP